MSPRKRSYNKGLGEGLTINSPFKKDDEPWVIFDYRLSAQVITAPTIRRMCWCAGTGIPPPPNTSDTVWSVVDCCPQGKTDNNKKHWWNI